MIFDGTSDNLLINQEPDYSEVYIDSGSYLPHNKGELDKVITDYTIAIELNPHLAEPYYCFVNILLLFTIRRSLLPMDCLW